MLKQDHKEFDDAQFVNNEIIMKIVAKNY